MLHKLAYSVDGDDDGLGHDLSPGYLYQQFMDAAGDEREGQRHFLLQHVRLEHQVVQRHPAAP